MRHVRKRTWVNRLLLKGLGILAFLFLSGVLYAPSLEIDIEKALKEKNEYIKKCEQERFLDALAHSESRGNYEAWNKYGYIGRYQFGHSARKSTGYSDISFYAFVKDPSIWTPEQQDSAMLILLDLNRGHLESLIEFIDTNEVIIRGKKITESGLLAGAHLAGYNGVKKYFYKKRNPRDTYGTSVEDYIVKFSGYSI